MVQVTCQQTHIIKKGNNDWYKYYIEVESLKFRTLPHQRDGHASWR